MRALSYNLPEDASPMWKMPTNAPPRLVAVPARRVDDLPSGLVRSLREAPSCAATAGVFDVVELARMPAATRLVDGHSPDALEDVAVLAHEPGELLTTSEKPRSAAAPRLDLRSDELRGLVVVVTRAAHQVRTLADKLEARGARVVALPAIAIVPPADPSGLDETLRSVNTFDAVVFTSENGVVRAFERVRALGLDARHFAGRIVAAIGPGTASALAREGLRADLMPEEHIGEALALALNERLARGQRVAIVRATEARDVLPELLRAAGHEVVVTPAYTTERAFNAQRFASLVEASRGHTRVSITFTSASTARSVVEALDAASGRHLLAECIRASIGPVTSAELHRLELRATCEASPYTLDGVVDAIARAHREATP